HWKWQCRICGRRIRGARDCLTCAGDGRVELFAGGRRSGSGAVAMDVQLLLEHHADDIIELPVHGATDERGSDGGGNAGGRRLDSDLRIFDYIAADDTEQCDIDHIYSKDNSKWGQCSDPDSASRWCATSFPGKYVRSDHGASDGHAAVDVQ